MLKLNNLAPDKGSKASKKRLGRGIGSGLGKTCGKGHKGQKARAGGFHKINFEGGQMPIQRRLPKMGFKSPKAKYSDQITLSELNNLTGDLVDLNVLKAHGLINKSIGKVKVILSGELKRSISISGLQVTKGARQAIEKAGGEICE